MRRGSVRLRLTVLFGALFLVAGAALLAITYGLVSHATNDIFLSTTNSSSGGGAGSAAGGGSAALPTTTDPLQAQAVRIAGTAKAAENDALLLYSGIALGIMAVVSMALGWFAAGRALRPLRRITAAARRISATNLDERLAVGEPDDDLRELADTIDDLFGRLDASFGAQRQFVANASHELRTPLARSRTMLEVALRDPGADAESLRTTCRRVLVAGEEQERLLEALLTLARGSADSTAASPSTWPPSPRTCSRRAARRSRPAGWRWPSPSSPPCSTATAPSPNAAWPTSSTTRSGTTCPAEPSGSRPGPNPARRC